MRRVTWCSILPALGLVLAASTASADDDDAHRHMIRGAAALESAKSDADLQPAIEEFKSATQSAPELPAAWFNLAVVQARAGQFEEAIASYKHYLGLKSDADDARQVNDEIIKLEFKLEQRAKIEGLDGAWLADEGTTYWLKTDNHHLTLKTKSRHVPVWHVYSTYPLLGRVPAGDEDITFDLNLEGQKLQGFWSRTEIKINACKVPGERGPVTGTLDEQSHTITLIHNRKVQTARTGFTLFADEYCMEQATTETIGIKQSFYGPLPKGFVPFAIEDDATFNHPWGGEIRVIRTDKTKSANDSALDALLDKDQLIAIDGAQVNAMTRGLVTYRLWGPVGSKVHLTLKHPKETTTYELDVTRPEAALYVPDWARKP